MPPSRSWHYTLALSTGRDVKYASAVELALSGDTAGGKVAYDLLERWKTGDHAASPVTRAKAERVRFN